MFLLVDTVSQPAVAVVFTGDRKVVLEKRETLSGKEYERFFEFVAESCAEAGTAVEALEGIACVRGPAGFTGIRVVTLTLGTLSLANGTKLFELDYAELCDAGKAAFPIVVNANREECAYCGRPGLPFEIRKKSDLPPGNYSGTCLESDFAGGNVRIEWRLDYAKAVKNLSLDHPSDRIEPFYIKKPNVT